MTGFFPHLINNLKGRRSYEEKKAAKLGFESLYVYFEDKILKQKKIALDEEKKFEILSDKNQPKSNKENKNKNNCSCC